MERKGARMGHSTTKTGSVFNSTNPQIQFGHENALSIEMGQYLSM